MKKHRFAYTLCLLLSTLATRAEDGLRDLNIGDPAPEFALPGIDGKMHHLSDYKEGKVLMIAFISNHCPTSHAAEGRLRKHLADTKEKGLTFVAINPNHPDGLSIDELGYSKYNDGFEDIRNMRPNKASTSPTFMMAILN